MPKTLRHLGKPSRLPASPQAALLDRVANPHPDTDYVARFTAPEFTTLCPITGQPDFAHFVIDYVPAKWLLESKSFKLYFGSFRNVGAFHEDCTVAIGEKLVGLLKPKLRIGAMLVSARRHSNRRFLAIRQAAGERVAARPRRRLLSRAGLSRGNDCQERLHFAGRFERAHDAAHDGNTDRPGGENLRRARRIEAADRQDRNRSSPGDFGQALAADLGTVSGLARRLEGRPRDCIIDDGGIVPPVTVWSDTPTSFSRPSVLRAAAASAPAERWTPSPPQAFASAASPCTVRRAPCRRAIGKSVEASAI